MARLYRWSAILLLAGGLTCMFVDAYLEALVAFLLVCASLHMSSAETATAHRVAELGTANRVSARRCECMECGKTMRHGIEPTSHDICADCIDNGPWAEFKA